VTAYAGQPARVDAGLAGPDGPHADGAPAGEHATAAPRGSPWLALTIVLVGSYAAVLNTTVVGVALPSIAQELRAGSGAIEVDWVVTSFLVGVVLVQPVTGWLADRFGRRRVYVASLLTFGAGALLCASAPSMWVLIAGRVVQGVGGGALIPVGMAMVYELFPPHRRGTALGIWGVGIVGAPAAGPPLGGWVATAASWRWIFGAFVVIAAGAALLARWRLRDSGHREVRRLDVTGWVLAGTGVLLLVIASRQAADWGPTSVATLAMVGTSVAVLAVWVRRSRRRPEPIIELRMFAIPTFAVGMTVVWLLSIAQFARLNFLPVELQVVRDLDASQVGLLLAPAAAGVALTMPLGGWLADRVGARAPVVVGLSLVAASMWQLAHLQPTDSERRIVTILVVQGLGHGLAFVPTAVAAMNSIPQRFVAQASAVNALNRQLAGAVGVALLGAVLVADLGAVAPAAPVIDAAQSAYNRIFMVGFWFVVAALSAAMLLPGRRRSAEHQAIRAAEVVD
jgi:EmrB/QacA subfamily drug resistance transporter